MSPGAQGLWAAVQAARDDEAFAALAWAEAVGAGHDEADAWERSRRAERAAYEAFARAVDAEAGPARLAA